MVRLFFSILNMSAVTALARASVALIASSGNVWELSASIGYKKTAYIPIAAPVGRFSAGSQELSYTSKSMSPPTALVAENVAPSVNKSSAMANSIPRSKENEDYWHIAVLAIA